MSAPSPELIIAPVSAILMDAARAEQISVEDIVASGPGHHRLRCAIAWAARKSGQATLEQIGEVLGGRSASTITRAIEQATRLRKEDWRFVHVSDFLRTRARKRAELARSHPGEGEYL